MTRPLLLTAALGLVASIACFALAWTLGGFQWGRWMIDGGSDRAFGPAVFGGGPTVTRDLPWSGGDALTVGAPADVVFTQGPVAKVTVTGPQGAADALELHDGRLRFRRNVTSDTRLQVAITAPDVREFTVAGSGDLRIEGLDQDHVEVQVFGSGDVTARGKAHALDVSIAGSGDANLGQLLVDTAEAHIAGSGRVTVAARDRTEADIAGSGDIKLAVEPRDLETHIMGSGRIVHDDRTPSAPPAPPLAAAAPDAPRPL